MGFFPPCHLLNAADSGGGDGDVAGNEMRKLRKFGHSPNTISNIYLAPFLCFATKLTGILKWQANKKNWNVSCCCCRKENPSVKFKLMAICVILRISSCSKNAYAIHRVFFRNFKKKSFIGKWFFFFQLNSRFSP